jgi:hypothetical protein
LKILKRKELWLLDERKQERYGSLSVDDAQKGEDNENNIMKEEEWMPQKIKMIIIENNNKLMLL